MTRVITDARSAAGRRHRRGAVAMSLTLAVLMTAACVASSVVTHPVTLGSDSARVVTEAARAQLIDGSTVTLPEGFRVEGNQLVGSGWRFAPTGRDSVQVSAIPRDSVASVVAYGTAIDPAKSVGMSVAAAVTLAFLLAIAFIAGCAATSCLKD